MIPGRNIFANCGKTVTLFSLPVCSRTRGPDCTLLGFSTWITEQHLDRWAAVFVLHEPTQKTVPQRWFITKYTTELWNCGKVGFYTILLLTYKPSSRGRLNLVQVTVLKIYFGEKLWIAGVKCSTMYLYIYGTFEAQHKYFIRTSRKHVSLCRIRTSISFLKLRGKTWIIYDENV